MRLSTCLVLLAALPFAHSFDYESAHARARALGLEPRQNSGSAAGPSAPAVSTPAAPAPSTPPANDPTPEPSTPAVSTPRNNQPSSTAQPPANDQNTPRSSQQQASATPQPEQSTPANDNPGSQQNTAASRTQSPQPSRSPVQSLVTDDSGNVVTVTVIPSAEESSAPSASSTPRESKPISQSTIIGLSVAGGITLLGIIAFIVWKLTNKRFSNFDEDDGEPIKWPEVNNANSQDLNSRAAAGLGGASLDSRSEVFHSTSELSHDPYRVPPLPPAQATYTDDPAGYYDPYRGPVPQTFATPPQSHDGHYAGEAIPMSTYGRSRSPGPNAAYDPNAAAYADPYARSGSPGPALAYDAGRRSPGPGLAYDPSGRGSPAPPNMGMYDQGRSSPSPYDQGRRSPGPNLAYGGRTSPGPGLAYGGRTSPGPNLAYDQGYR